MEKKSKITEMIAVPIEEYEDRPFQSDRVVIGRRGPGWIVTVLIAVIMSASASAASVYIYDGHYAQKVVAIDVKGYIGDIRDLYMAGKLTDDQLKERMDRLEAVVNAMPSNEVAIMGDAVLHNAKILKP